MVCFGQLLRIKLRAKNFLITVDDVWDEDSAYLEMLAEQVKKITYSYLPIPFS